MTTSKKSITRCAISGLVALLIGLPAAASRADEPMTAVEAQARAEHYGAMAAQVRTLGAVAYKTGQVQRAESQQAKYTAMAEQLAAPATPAPTPSPIAEHYADLADHYRAMGGGPAYKWGRVASAEADRQHAEWMEQQAAAQAQPASYAGLPTVVEEPPTSAAHPACETVSKPVVRTLACAQKSDGTF